MIVCADDPNIAGLLPRLAERRVTTYGLAAGRACCAPRHSSCLPTGHRSSVRHRLNGELARSNLPLAGLHNVRNALAAVGVALALGIPMPVVARALAGFAGVHRRFERLGQWRGADGGRRLRSPSDRGHRRPSTRRVRSFPRRVLHAVFQPHLYSRHPGSGGGVRTRPARRLTTSWSPTSIRRASNRSKASPASWWLAPCSAVGHPSVDYCADWRAAAVLFDGIDDGDVVMTLGAGDIYRLAEALVKGDVA